MRYGRLLPVTKRSRALGRAYAAIVAAVELRADARRRGAAVDRIERWLGVTPDAATRIFRGSLRSEALEEADSTFFMHHPHALATTFHIEGAREPERPLIHAILHFGSPILAYLHVARIARRAVHAVGRALDASNPMPDAKRRYAERKVAWVYTTAGRPFVGVDGRAMVDARELLLGGESLYAAIDVPGDVVSRSATVTIHDEPIHIAAGIPTLAAMTRTPLQPVLAISHPTHLTLTLGDVVEPTTPAATLEAITRTLFAEVDRHPSEWWLWPYMPTAPRR